MAVRPFYTMSDPFNPVHLSVCLSVCLSICLSVYTASRLMLRRCEDFASKRWLPFNQPKTQLICYSWSSSSSCKASFTFCGQQLSFVDTVICLGHLLHYNLSHVPDINHKLRDMVKKANCLLASFPRIGPFILTRLFQSYYLSLKLE